MTVHDGIDTGRPVRLALGSRAAGLTLGAALLTTGLMAGVYYDWAVSVMPGLARTDDRTFVYVMQEITEAIQNPVFFLGFFGAPLLTLGALLLERRSGAQQAVRWIWAALGLNVLAVVVTIAFNVPLNDELVRAGNPDEIGDIAAVRDRFEDPWVAWNIVRTLVATAALACLGWALVLHGGAAATRTKEAT
jgi:uncharacterized membrane protein